MPRRTSKLNVLDESLRLPPDSEPDTHPGKILIDEQGRSSRVKYKLGALARAIGFDRYDAIAVEKLTVDHLVILRLRLPSVMKPATAKAVWSTLRGMLRISHARRELDTKQFHALMDIDWQV